MQTRYRLEWCSEIPKIPGTDDGDMDRAVYVKETYRTLAGAAIRAKTLIRGGLDCFGVVSIDYQELEIDPDILEHEGREVETWTTKREYIVDDPNGEPIER